MKIRSLKNAFFVFIGFLIILQKNFCEILGKKPKETTISICMAVNQFCGSALPPLWKHSVC